MSDNFTEEELVEIFSNIKEKDLGYHSDSYAEAAKDDCKIKLTYYRKKDKFTTKLDIKLNGVEKLFVYDQTVDHLKDTLFHKLFIILFPEYDSEYFKKKVKDIFKK